MWLQRSRCPGNRKQDHPQTLISDISYLQLIAQFLRARYTVLQYHRVHSIADISCCSSQVHWEPSPGQPSQEVNVVSLYDEGLIPHMEETLLGVPPIYDPMKQGQLHPHTGCLCELQESAVSKHGHAGRISQCIHFFSFVLPLFPFDSHGAYHHETRKWHQ